MDIIESTNTIRFRDDTLEYVRKDVNLESIERINEAVDILEDWIRKQPHFLKKDYSRDYMERTIVIAKGHVEGAKQRLDKLCTLRTLMPDVFTPSPDLKSVFERVGQRLPHAFLPTLTKKSCRLFLLKIAADFEANDVYNFYKMAAMYVEYLRKHDYSSGNRLILDYRHANIVNQIPNINPLDMKQIATIIFEGYGLRIKGLYIISPSKAIRLFVAIVKQALSKKLASRLHVLRDIKELYEIVPQELMPREYGGKEKPLKELYDEWCNTVSGEKFQAYYKEMREAATVEARRPPDMFNEQYLGLSGSFRVLTVD